MVTTRKLPQVCFEFGRSRVQISAQIPALPTRSFRFFPTSFHTKAEMMLQNRPLQFPSTSLPIHNSSLDIIHFELLFAFLNKRQINIGPSLGNFPQALTFLECSSNWNGPVGNSDGLWAGGPWFDSRQMQDFSLLHSVQTGSGAHPVSYPIRIGGKAAGA
jgi:hypothetical protein